MKILITGGAGFIGSHLVEYFLRHGHDVVVMDRLSYAGSLERISWLRDEFGERLFFVFHDFRAALPTVVLHKLEGVSTIIHNGGESHVEPSIVNPGPFVQSNVLGTMHMLEAARSLGVERFLYTSTDEVYGPSLERDFTEESPCKPSSPYSATKAGGEALVLAWATTYSLPITITRTMNIFGERQHPEKFIPGMIRKMLDGEKVNIHGGPNGEIGSRKWLYASDYACALAFILEHPHSLNQIINIAGVKKDNLEMAELVARLLGVSFSFRVVNANEYRPGHDLHYAIDDSKLRCMGWDPSFEFEAALKRVVEWTVKHQEWIAA